jgi:hypothetical protein
MEYNFWDKWENCGKWEINWKNKRSKVGKWMGGM